MTHGQRHHTPRLNSRHASPTVALCSLCTRTPWTLTRPRTARFSTMTLVLLSSCAAADARGAALLAATAGQPAASHGAPRQPAAARSPPSLSTVFRSSSPQPGLTPAPNSSLQLQPLKVHAPSSCTSASKLAHAKDDAVRRTRATQAAAAPDARAGTSFSTRRVRAK